MKTLESIPHGKVYRFAIIYILAITVIAASVNYFTWGRPFDLITSVLAVLMWIALYAPMPIFIKKADWKLSDFGFVLNIKTIIVSAILASLLVFKMGISFSMHYLPDAAIVAFARVGEEVFYRGFIYFLILKLFNGKKGANFWAIVLSSLLFAAMHTQTFLPSNRLSMWDIFINSLLFMALLRYFTGSILPGIIVHLASNTGLLGMVLGILIYLVFVAINHFLKARVSKASSEKTDIPNDMSQ